MNTKERILDEALTLFSRRGFDGVTVKDIAASVGIKDSSLYKHFPSKQVIFDTILAQMQVRLDEMHTQLNVPDARTKDVSAHFSTLGDNPLTDMVERMFLFYLKDPIIGRLRRLFTIEQFGNSEIARQYGSMFIDSALDYHVVVFKQMMVAGAFIEGDPTLMALEFYSPIFLLLSRVDGQPETEAASIHVLKQHVVAFGARYGAPGKENKV